MSKLKTTNRPAKKIDDKQNKALESLDRRLARVEGETEVKYADEYTGSSVVSTGGNFSVPVTPAPRRGTGPNDRVGDEIFLTSWHVKLQVLTNQELVGGTVMRFIFFIDKMNDGAQPPLFTWNGGVLVSPRGLLETELITDPTKAFYNQDARDRYKIMHDELVVLNPAVHMESAPDGGNWEVTEVARRAWVKEFFFPIRKKIRYTQDLGLITDLIGNVPYFVALSNQTTYPPTIQFSGRIYFKDA